MTLLLLLGATYDTLRGRFKIVSLDTTVSHGLILERADRRRVSVAFSDFMTWHPQIVDDTTNQTQDMVDELKPLSEGKGIL